MTNDVEIVGLTNQFYYFSIFTYWHPGDNTPWDFHDSPINLDGSRTVVVGVKDT